MAHHCIQTSFLGLTYRKRLAWHGFVLAFMSSPHDIMETVGEASRPRGSSPSRFARDPVEIACCVHALFSFFSHFARLFLQSAVFRATDAFS